MNDLLRHLSKYGLQPFQDPAKYEHAVLESFGNADFAKLQKFSNISDNRKNVAWNRRYYDFLAGSPRRAIYYSLKTLTLAAFGTNIEPLLPTDGRILEIGTGVGWLATWYAAKSSARKVVAIDVSPGSIRAAEKMAKRLGITNVEFACADFREYSSDQSFDAVVDTQAACDLEDTSDRFFARVRSFLRSGGHALTVPSRGSAEHLATYLKGMQAAGISLELVGGQSTKDMGTPYTYPLVVGVAGNCSVPIDLQATCQSHRVMLAFLHWDIFLRAHQGAPVVAAFFPGPNERPDLLLPGDRVVSVNGVPFEELRVEDMNALYAAAHKWVLCFDRGGLPITLEYA